MTWNEVVNWMATNNSVIQAAGVIITAAATVVLAVVTYSYAKTTKALVDQSRIAELARLEPVVLAISPRIERHAEKTKGPGGTEGIPIVTDVLIRATVRNVGQGPAFSIEIALTVDGIPSPVVIRSVWQGPSYVTARGGPPQTTQQLEGDEQGRISFHLRPTMNAEGQDTSAHFGAVQRKSAGFTLRCSYTTSLNERKETSITVRQDEDGQAVVVDRNTPPRLVG